MGRERGRWVYGGWEFKKWGKGRWREEVGQVLMSRGGVGVGGSGLEIWDEYTPLL